ncbi:unnamed protein product, partial [Rotaria magnacalcarata]
MAEAVVTLTSEIQAKSPQQQVTRYWICTINGCAAKVHTDSNNRLMKTVGNRSHLPGKEKLE